MKNRKYDLLRTRIHNEEISSVYEVIDKEPSNIYRARVSKHISNTLPPTDHTPVNYNEEASMRKRVRGHTTDETFTLEEASFTLPVELHQLIDEEEHINYQSLTNAHKEINYKPLRKRKQSIEHAKILSPDSVSDANSSPKVESTYEAKRKRKHAYSIDQQLMNNEKQVRYEPLRKREPKNTETGTIKMYSPTLYPTQEIKQYSKRKRTRKKSTVD